MNTILVLSIETILLLFYLNVLRAEYLVSNEDLDGHKKIYSKIYMPNWIPGSYVRILKSHHEQLGHLDKNEPSMVDPDDNRAENDFPTNSAKYYFVKKQLNAPKLGHHLPMRWPDNSAKIRTGRTKGLEINGMCCPELAVTPKNLSNKSLPWTSGPSYWQPILDGTIIAAIGGLFTKRIKDESNRERLERMKLREMQLLKNLTKLIDDFAEFDTLKRESEKAEKHINQEIR